MKTLAPALDLNRHVRVAIHETSVRHGFTLSLRDLPPPAQGYTVGGYGSEVRIKLPTPYLGSLMTGYVNSHLPVLMSQGAYWGGWVSGQHLFLDVSRNFSDLDTALQLAQRSGEREIWDVSAGRGIPVPPPAPRKRAAK